MYEILKALHVAAVVVFIGGMISVSVFLAALARFPLHGDAVAVTRAVRLWDQRVTTPAMLLTWALGLTMALQAGWFASYWLQIKLVFVLILSGLHGMQSGRLRRLAAGPGRVAGKPFGMMAAILVIGCLVIVAFLAVLKPA